jgi:hypothetical protein
VKSRSDELHVKRVARFAPLRTDDLCADAQRAIGLVLPFYAGWIIETGPYEGQIAWIPLRGDFSMGWVPTCDLIF